MTEKVEIEDVRLMMDEFKNLHKSFGDSMVANKESALSFNQCSLLYIIDNCKSTNQKEIAKNLHITPATLSVRLQRLEKAGYLKREIDLNDKRNYLLTITKKGKMLKDETTKLLEEEWLKIFDGFTKSEISQMVGYLERMKKNIRNIQEEKQC